MKTYVSLFLFIGIFLWGVVVFVFTDQEDMQDPLEIDYEAYGVPTDDDLDGQGIEYSYKQTDVSEPILFTQPYELRGTITSLNDHFLSEFVIVEVDPEYFQRLPEDISNDYRNIMIFDKTVTPIVEQISLLEEGQRIEFSISSFNPGKKGTESFPSGSLETLKIISNS